MHKSASHFFDIFIFDQRRITKIEFIFLVPFIPKQPNEMLKSGDMYLKSIDANYRRSYDKFVANDNSERDNDNANNVQQLYVRNKYFYSYEFFLLIFFSRLNIFKTSKLVMMLNMLVSFVVFIVSSFDLFTLPATFVSLRCFFHKISSRFLPHICMCVFFVCYCYYD